MKALKIVFSLVIASLLGACGLLNTAPAANATPQELRVNIFPGGFNWPIWAGQEKGYFVRNGDHRLPIERKAEA